MRESATLECTACKNRNYITEKNKRKTTGRLQISKYCKFCRKHVEHKEIK